MARSHLTVQAIGIEKALEMIGTSAMNLSDLRRAKPIVEQLLFIMYSRRWDRWGDYLYETGRLEDSFTDAGSMDAIRSAHFDQIEYGSSVPYAQFFSGQLLSVDAKTEQDLAEAMADYYAGDRLVRGHLQGGQWIAPYIRRNAALANAHL